MMKNRIEIILTFLLLSMLVGCVTKDSIPTFPADQDPVITTFMGPSETQVGQPCTFNASGFDPDGNTVAFHLEYWINTDPNINFDLGFTANVNNNEQVTWSIVFNLAGDYALCCYCIDQNGNESVHKPRGIKVNQ